MKIISAIVVALALLTACAGEKEKRAINAVSVDGQASFSPQVIKVNKDDKVDITLGNTTDKQHGFTIDGYGLEPTTVDPNNPIEYKFTASKAGTFRIFCQLHPAHLNATLQVD